jgi:HK97 family phage prohead protease
MTTLTEAAELRSQNVRAAADRPSQRRCSDVIGSLPIVRAKARLEIRDAGQNSDGSVHFNGYASVTDTSYEMYDMFGPYTEQVTSGAFSSSLARSDLDVPLVLQHQDLRRIARTTNGSLTLSEDQTGLLVDAPNLDMTDHDVAYIVPKLRAGLIDEMSFKFRITSGSWSPDWTEYHIEEADIHRGDVAIVGYGANPHTAGAALRAADLEAEIRGLGDNPARHLYDLLAVRFAAPKTTRGLITDEDTRVRVIR